MPEDHVSSPLITNDAVILGILMVMLGAIFTTAQSERRVWKTFYQVVPMLLLCYFLPSLLTAFGVVDPKQSRLNSVASQYLLPASLVLLTISIDLREVLKLGPKALVMFLTGSVGVILGGPLAMWLVGQFNPELVGGEGHEAVWRGMATVAGSWIGGAANQAAMKEIFTPSDRLYSLVVAMDVIIAEIWLLFLLLGVGKAQTIDRWTGADTSSIVVLQHKMEHFSLSTARIPTTSDLMAILAVAFGATAVCHAMSDQIAPWIRETAPSLSRFSLDSEFFWLIVLATTVGLVLSGTRLRHLEGAGASKVGTLFLFVLVATIGLKMDIRVVRDHPGLFLVGGVWMLIHVGLLIIMAVIIKAPYFFLAVGSQANIGGVASAPIIAAAVHPSLAPVGVLLAVLGYALGTYGAWLSAMVMQRIALVPN